MIFRLMHGGVRENLALIPVVHEWRLRKLSEKLFVETTLPEIFDHNPDLDGVGSWFDEQQAIDFDIINDPELGLHPIDLYALAALGDNRLQSRRMKIFANPETDRFGLYRSNSVFVGVDFAARHRGLHELLMRRFPVVSVIGYCPTQLGDVCFDLAGGSLFVGCDEDITWLAMTTEIPIVMLTGPRQASSCQPFREGISFETVAWKCDLQDSCLKRNVAYGFGNIYHIYCRKEPSIACENLVSKDELMAAVDRALKA